VRRCTDRVETRSSGIESAPPPIGRRPSDRRCVFLGWLIVIIIVLAVIGAVTLVRGVGRRA
jgi:hypothetical protein